MPSNLLAAAKAVLALLDRGHVRDPSVDALRAAVEEAERASPETAGKTSAGNMEQPKPLPNKMGAVWPLVIDGVGHRHVRQTTPAEHFRRCGPFCAHVQHCPKCANVHGFCGGHATPDDAIRWADPKGGES